LGKNEATAGPQLASRSQDQRHPTALQTLGPNSLPNRRLEHQRRAISGPRP